jgi:hypothetical protein
MGTVLTGTPGIVTLAELIVSRSPAAFPIVVLPLTVRFPLVDREVPLMEELDEIEPVTERLFDITVAPVTLSVLLIVNGLANVTFPKNDALALHVKFPETARNPAMVFDADALV